MGRADHEEVQPAGRRKAGAERASSGAAFLAAKKQARDDAREAVRAAGALADGAFEALAGWPATRGGATTSRRVRRRRHCSTRRSS